MIAHHEPARTFCLHHQHFISRTAHFTVNSRPSRTPSAEQRSIGRVVPTGPTRRQREQQQLRSCIPRTQAFTVYTRAPRPSAVKCHLGRRSTTSVRSRSEGR